MALRNTDAAQAAATATAPTDSAAAPAPKPSAAPAAGPAFEDDMDAAAAPAQATATEIAAATSTALSVRKVIDPNTALRGLKDAIPTDELEKIGFSVFPRITTSLEGFKLDKAKNLGRRIRVEVISWSYVTLVAPGEQNDTEANKLIRTTYRGEVLQDGTNVHAYASQLKAAGYKNAAVKNYAELYVMLTGFMELKGDNYVRVDIPEEEQAMHQVSLSPQSLGQWGRYQMESGIRKARGMADDAKVTLVLESKTAGANTFPIATFTPKWA